MSLTTKQIPAVYHNQNLRTEFRLNPDQLYASNLRMAVQSGVNGQVYNINTGVYGLVKNIRFMDGNIQIDALQQAPRVAAVKINMRENRKSLFYENVLANNSYGYKVSKIGGKYLIDSNPDRVYIYSDNMGYLELKPLLQFLQATRWFSFKDPRILVEWNTNLRDVLAYDAEGQINIPEPLLIADEVLGGPRFSGVEYYSLEYDRIILDGIDNTAGANELNRKVKHRVDGFNNKNVRRLLIANTPAGYNNYEGNNISQLDRDGKYQLFLNNSEVFPAEVDIQTRQQYFNQIWGDFNIPWPQYQYTLTEGHELSNGRISGQDSYVQAYGSALIEGRVENLEIEYSRTAEAGQDLAQNTLHFFGEVSKKVSFDGQGRAIVGYA